MAKKRGAAHGGGHGWFVTFADLMGLLVAFFVMLVAFSTQDQVKLQIVAGSMRDAFGVQDRVRYSGVIEIPGPADPAEAQERRADLARGGVGDAHPRRARPPAYLRRQVRGGSRLCARLGVAAPGHAGHARHRRIVEALMIEETKQGLNIEIVDQDGRSMFPGRVEGAPRAHAPADPAARRRRSRPRPSASRSPATPRRAGCRRRPATDRGSSPPTAPTRCASSSRRRACRPPHIYMVAGRADTQPLFPDDPYIAANRRVTITLMREEPPIPPNFKP